MGKFNGKIKAEFTAPKTWILAKGLSFITEELDDEEISILQEVGANISNTGRVTCKKGMKTDLASVPRACWTFLAPWDVARAAVIHDHLYAKLRWYYHSEEYNKEVWTQGRTIADKVFLLGMNAAEPIVPAWKKHAAYRSVRMFGSRPASRKKDK